MARPKPNPDARALEIVTAAAQVFAQKGYRTAQMVDIAANLNRSAGTLYNAVASKEVLFEAVLLHEFGLAEDLPKTLSEKPTTSLVERIRAAIDATELLPKIAAAVTLGPIPNNKADYEKELFEIVEEQLDFMMANGNGVQILEKSTIDYPELAEAYFGYLRALVIERWETYLATRQAAGYLAPEIETQIAARSAIEVIAWWTIRNPNDPGSDHYRKSRIRKEVIDFVCRALT
jgi:AcrR family transcriptional regulator